MHPCSPGYPTTGSTGLRAISIEGFWELAWEQNKKPPRGKSVMADCEMLLVLLIIVDHLRRGFGHFNFGAHFLDERFLLFQFCFESVIFLWLPLHSAVLFEKFIEQHRVHRFVADGEDYPFTVTHHPIGMRLF